MKEKAERAIKEIVRRSEGGHLTTPCSLATAFTQLGETRFAVEEQNPNKTNIKR